MEIEKWVWQHKDYPDFPYVHTKELIDSLAAVYESTGRLNEVLSHIDPKSVVSVQAEAIVDEILSTNEIEGEYLSRSSVISSVRKAIDPQFDLEGDRSTHDTDALVSILMDSNTNQEPLTKERLHGWHNALFPSGYSGMTKIKTAAYRDDPMQVISGPIGRTKVHYEAPEADMLEAQMDALITYINESEDNPFIKSAKAHLWFITIHPYDDGNGRISRVIADYILSKELGMTYKFHAISSAINLDKKQYYDILEKSQNLFHNRDHDFTKWFKWHLDIHAKSLTRTIEKTKIVIDKAKFWDMVNTNSLNPRQKKILNTLSKIGIDNFQGGLSTKKYINMAKTSRATATRDLQDLVDKGYLRQVEGTAGRNVRYEVAIPDSEKPKTSKLLNRLQKELDRKEHTKEREI